MSSSSSAEPFAKKARALVHYGRRHTAFFEAKLSPTARRVIRDAADFGARVPVSRLEDLVAAKLATRDPYSGRCSRIRRPLVTFQMEYLAETPLYVGLDRSDLRGYADALSRCWTVAGLRRGDRLVIFDFGSSPVSYLASSFFTPYLRHGAGDLLGCVPVCNDGVATMSHRAVQMVRFIRPRMLFLRTDVLFPFATDVAKARLSLSGDLRAVVVTENEGVLDETTRDEFQRRLGVPIYRLARVDAALFFAMECPACRFFHFWPELHHVEVVREESARTPADERGALALTTWFARVCPSIRFLSQLRGVLDAGRCPRFPRAGRVRL